MKSFKVKFPFWMKIFPFGKLIDYTVCLEILKSNVLLSYRLYGMFRNTQIQRATEL